MYSLVLLMAMTGPAEAPALGHHSCCGCSGYSCCGGDYGCCGGGWSCCGGGYSCCGGGYGCCGGSSCSGCCGGGHHHHHGHHHHSCCGCSGSYGCCGGGWSCCGGGYGCSGSYGCCGGNCGGYSSCCGGAGYGCAGGYAVPGGAPVIESAPPAGTPAPMPKPPVSDGKPKEEVNAPAPATIQVSLPADAKLMIDGAKTVSTSASRLFVSPELAPAKDFQYTLRAEIIRDGQSLTATERVTVRAGMETRVSLPLSRFATTTVAAK
jgi:uncharacterized protein (TIGR03000 family)